LLAEGAYAKKLEMICLIDPRMPSMVRGDPTRLRQVFLNLINNAIKFTSDGVIAIRVNCLHENDDWIQIRVEVQDSGIGIAADAQAAIFSPFCQADGSMARRFGGTGLGLAIVKQLVTAMGGEIGVVSEPGQGALFWFSIPFKNLAYVRHARAVHSAHFGDVRTLIGVCSAPVGQAIVQLTTSWGMRSETIESGSQALFTIQRAADQGEPYALLILEARLPDLDLAALSTALQADALTASTQILLLVSPSDARDSVLCADNEICTKPVTTNKLYACLECLFRGISNKHLPATEEKRVDFDAHILVAEDNLVNQEVTSAMLTFTGCRVDMVCDGRQALAALAGKHYDMVFMDCQMPEMDGYEATRAIRSREAAAGSESHIPVVALTAHAMEGDRNRCLAAGMDDYLTKPFSLEKIQEMLAKWLPRGQGRARARPSRERTLGGPDESKGGFLDRLFLLESIDRSALDSLYAIKANGYPSVLVKMIQRYLENSPAQMQTLGRAITSGDAVAMKKTAHSLISASGFLGAKRIVELCKEIQILGQADAVEQAVPLLPVLETEYEKVREAISEELRSINETKAPSGIHGQETQQEGFN
jgi:CheY-like chemotaxis protein/HPt (histidine-containing phosphotransfer) domain-containing protein